MSSEGSNGSVPSGTELVFTTLKNNIASVMPEGKTVDVKGVTYTIPELVEKVDELRALYSDPRETIAKLAQQVQARKAGNADALAFLRELKVVLAGVLKDSSEEYLKLGFKPARARRQLTVEEQIARAAKAKITRALRHTLGSRQKEDLNASGSPDIVVAHGRMTITPTPADVALLARADAPVPLSGATIVAPSVTAELERPPGAGALA